MRSPLLHAGLITFLLVSLALAGVHATPTEGIGATKESVGDNLGIDGRSLPRIPNISGLGIPDAMGWYEQGFALTGEERYGEALQAYEKALSYNRSLLNAWYYSGDALFRLGRYDEALLAFGNATAIDPDFVDAYFYEARVYERLGRLEDRKEALERGLEAAERKRAAGNDEASATPATGGSVFQPLGPAIPFLGAAIAAGILALSGGKRGP